MSNVRGHYIMTALSRLVGLITETYVRKFPERETVYISLPLF